jgi:hypothetical protein
MTGAKLREQWTYCETLSNNIQRSRMSYCNNDSERN